jgi:anion-transporting  ArsA/GET3 family ATPase
MGSVSELMSRRLIVVTGKGGVGKSTVSLALGLLAARRGLRTIVVEVSAGAEPEGSPLRGVEREIREGLWGVAVDRDRVLAEWLRAVGGRVPAAMLSSSASFQYLVAAAPGAREMLTMVKVWELAESKRPADRGSPKGRAPKRPAYDLVILDAPATGHALAMLRAPHTYAAIARVGPIARQSGHVRDLVDDPARSAYLAVTHPTEMAVTETLELRASLQRDLGRDLDAVVVNATLPRRFERGELLQLAPLNGQGAHGEAIPNADGRAAVRSAVRAAHAVHERARTQRSQIARLRRDAAGPGSPAIVSVPFLFRAELDVDALERIADRLARGV